MRGSLEAEPGEPASRDPGGIEAPRLLLDAACVKRGRDGRARSTAAVTAIGAGSGGAASPASSAASAPPLPSKCHRAMAAEAMRAVFRESGPAAVRSAYRAAIDAVGAPLEDAGADALAYPGFPAEHGRRIRADNVRERMNREVKLCSLT